MKTRPRAAAALLAALVAAPSCSERDSGPRVPANRYVVTIHYELGMHCSAFDLSYCCVLPPYNSVLAQVVETSPDAATLPRLLSGADLEKSGLVLYYEHDRNTHSEGNKLLYWNVPADVNRNGSLSDPFDSFVNEEFRHLYTYAEAPFHAKPAGASRKLRIGVDLPIRLDSGITGKPVSGGLMDWSGSGAMVYTVSNDGVSEVPIPLGMRDYFEALALPLTPFFDGEVPFLRAITEELIRPYQSARVTLGRFSDKDGNGLPSREEIDPERQRDGRAATFMGTNPIDVPACDRCHASARANGDEFHLWKKEYAFWTTKLHNTSPYFARTKAAAVSMLEIHDKRHGTDFLSKYDPDDPTGSTITRLGRTPVRCQDCHGDNVLGVLDASPPRDVEKVVPSLSASIHRLHLEKAPQPDRFGRPANCQTCHPAHMQSGNLDRLPTDAMGEFKGGEHGDVREFWGGCFLGRDVHSNPRKSNSLRTHPHLNAIGKWMQESVFSEGKGLYCTHCHNLGSRLLYKWDELDDAIAQTGMPVMTGPTLRNQEMGAILGAFRSMEESRYATYTAEDFFDPKVRPGSEPGGKNPVIDVWTDPTNPGYAEIDDGGDFWLSAGEPHCADCHVPPFVEGLGGTYRPIDSERKYSLMRFSKGHHGISCQSCHQSTHGLFPVAENGPDPTSLAQARQFHPDGTAGPVTCVACHAVDPEGVPVNLPDALLAAYPDSEYPTRYEKAVAYAHAVRIPAERAAPAAGREPEEKRSGQ